MGVTRTVTTDSGDFYTAPNLVPGTYNVTGKAQGFQTYVRSGITLTVGAKQTVDIAMQVGQVSQQVQVTGEAAQVELTSSALSNVLTPTPQWSYR